MRIRRVGFSAEAHASIGSVWDLMIWPTCGHELTFCWMEGDDVKLTIVKGRFGDASDPARSE